MSFTATFRVKQISESGNRASDGQISTRKYIELESLNGRVTGEIRLHWPGEESDLFKVAHDYYVTFEEVRA